MNKATIEVAPATAGDLPSIVDIQNHTAATSHARFATRPFSAEERCDWFEQFAASGPYRILVARRGEQVLGYACSQRYRDQEAFRETVEVSIGLHDGSKGQGIGTSLYRQLFDLLDDEPVHTVLAGIAIPNNASVALHRKFGFVEIGVFHEYALKNGQYISSLWMERLQPHAPSDRVTASRVAGR
ncbi:GNAT family N-acetyltransferase [Streptomyces sp. NBC_00557]|uniref:GNAT family N-acetyltransferase n=1 Tax=Streptomyces sp. NBC_00557 TaxID=2975776 RepID=UPI002E800820|nr:N-acetyltransferase family protein [Streptomyces sp. NBC_00557]WUC39571.1 GNAT family N-acetyltransferase [Streptomyces sp. NBC_00557]